MVDVIEEPVTRRAAANRRDQRWQVATQRSPARVHAAPDSRRWRSNVPLLVAGGVAIVAGGLIAAVTGPTAWDHGSWVAAFLVLVAGVAQVGIAIAQSALDAAAPTARFASVECGLWSSGCVAVVAATLLSNPLTVSIGSALLAATLMMAAFAVRGSGDQRRVPLLLYRALLIVLLASIPIGVALAWARH
jgi:hypothetical protein